MLTLLDLSRAFDTADPKTLLRRQAVSYGLGGSVLAWFSSYLTRRKQCVRRGAYRSTLTDQLSGDPQGSVLEPILFLLNTANLRQLVERHDLYPHLYADETQIYSFCSPETALRLQQRTSASVKGVAAWMVESPSTELCQD